MLPALILAAAKDRLEASGLAPELRPLDVTSRDEVALVWTTLLKERCPRGTPWSEWRAVYGPEAAAHIERGPCVLAVAEGVFLGFALLDGPSVRMVFVKSAYRGSGLGALMLDAAGAPYPLHVVSANKSWKRWAESTGVQWSNGART